ncbi:MAG TPA: 2,3-bisphosphoglycerate-independent phosphoglycerate mutase [Thermomicrobiales bacterium]|nr:2,3-bisphosphoglycerate-independent phosphoglycerate mutase [Thermomicrobiales bacterium]
MSDRTPQLPHGPVVLVILDGWGLNDDPFGNAVLAAETPTMDRLCRDYPAAALRCSGEAVGLPEGQMGNSEVGHLNLGAGFIVYQWITRIDRAIADGAFAKNRALTEAMERVKRTEGKLHLIGLVSDGGVHSHVRHLNVLLELAKAQGVGDVLVHVVTDGRDTSPTGGAAYVGSLEETMRGLGVGRIATVSGRYYAMDRDHRWERTKRAFDAIVLGRGPRLASATWAIQDSYENGKTDEFIEPCVIEPGDQRYHGIEPDDGVIWFNFRADRARQLTEAMTAPAFDGFDREVEPLRHVVTLTRYRADFPVEVAFSPQDVERPMAQVVSDAGLAQFHTAETEKYAHVTFFFNGGREEPFPGEERELVPSPRVATYDLQPQMSAEPLTDGAIAAITSGKVSFVIINFANGDMVGHTGDFDAAVAAIETVDRCLHRIVDATLVKGGALLVTADHGNAEEMVVPETGQPMTAHTTNPVPVVLVTPEDHSLRQARLRQDGVLSAIAPTVLELLELEPPAEMDQPSLIHRS